MKFFLSEKRQNTGKISNFARNTEVFLRNQHGNWLLLRLFCLKRGKMLAKFPILPDTWKVLKKTGMKIGYYYGYCVLKEAKCCKNFQFLKFWLRYGCRLHKTVTVAKAVIFFYLKKNCGGQLGSNPKPRN